MIGAPESRAHEGAIRHPEDAGVVRAGATRRVVTIGGQAFTQRIDWTTKLILWLIASFLGIIASRPFFEPMPAVRAQAARFDHVTILGTTFLYKGQQGLLLLDRRNGNVWFVPKQNEVFKDPLFVMRMQFEKLDQAPQ